MLIEINQSYYQRQISSLACKLDIPPYSRHYTLHSLEQHLPVIQTEKSILSKTIDWYLENRNILNCKLDLNRKCRALGIPPFLTGINVKSPFLMNNFNRIAKELGYNKTRSKIIRHDIEELGIYMKMYQEIELVKDKLKDFYPYGNPFEQIMNLMSRGAVIVRFKYVKVGDKDPVERIISYHTFGDLYMLMVHIEGFEGFQFYKEWGKGDEKLTPITDEACNMQIRWGIDDFGKKGKFTY